MKTAIRKAGQRGFTLIELIITIVIIGILAAVAIPKFLNLSDDAEKATAAGVASALASGSSVNLAKSKSPSQVQNTNWWAVTACTGANSLDANKGNIASVPSDYSVLDYDTTALPSLTAGAGEIRCTISKGATKVNFIAYTAS